MSLLDTLLNCAENKLYQLENELNLIKIQLSIFPQMPGIDSKDSSILMLEYNMFFVVHKYLSKYYHALKDNYQEKCSYNDSLVIHFKAMQQMSINLFVSEITGHQQALSDLTESTLTNNGGTAEGTLLAVKRFFPYDLVLPLMINQLFFSKLLNFVFSLNLNSTKYKMTNAEYLKAVNNVLSLFRYNPIYKYVFIVISEMIVGYFSIKIPVRLIDFEFSERCYILMTQKFKSLFFNQISIINNEKEKEINPIHVSLRKFTNEVTDRKPFFPLDQEYANEIKCMRHITLELKKSTLNNSFSMILLSFYQATQYLSKTVSELEGNSPTGADETFHFLIYLICSSNIFNWKSIIEMTEEFCFNFLKESKLGYILEQIKSANKYIDLIDISQNDKILLPFLFQERAKTISIPKFQILLYPNESVPAIFIFTNDDNDIAKVYLQDYNKEMFTLKDVKVIETRHGLMPLYFGSNKLEIIDDSDYERYIALKT